MIRNLKALGLALVAVFAMGALTASSASAVTDLFTTSNAKPAIGTGVSADNVFKITGAAQEFKCTTSKFAITAKHGAAEATVDAEYTQRINETPHNTNECDSTAFGNVTVDMEGCDYDLSGVTHATPDGTDAAVWITCPVGKVIKITGFGATVTVPAQTPTVTPAAGQIGGGVTYTNKPLHTGGESIEVKATVTGITYDCHDVIPGTCNIAKIPAHGNDADYTGTILGTCWEDNEGLPTPVTEGARVGCSVS